MTWGWVPILRGEWYNTLPILAADLRETLTAVICQMLTARSLDARACLLPGCEIWLSINIGLRRSGGEVKNISIEN